MHKKRPNVRRTIAYLLKKLFILSGMNGLKVSLIFVGLRNRNPVPHLNASPKRDSKHEVIVIVDFNNKGSKV